MEKNFRIELLHNAGKMPDWAYYQLNGKNALENYIEQKKPALTDKQSCELETAIKEEIERILGNLF